jgi:hypothetical protein
MTRLIVKFGKGHYIRIINWQCEAGWQSGYPHNLRCFDIERRATLPTLGAKAPAVVIERLIERR